MDSSNGASIERVKLAGSLDGRKISTTMSYISRAEFSTSHDMTNLSASLSLPKLEFDPTNSISTQDYPWLITNHESESQRHQNVSALSFQPFDPDQGGHDAGEPMSAISSSPENAERVTPFVTCQESEKSLQKLRSSTLDSVKSRIESPLNPQKSTPTTTPSTSSKRPPHALQQDDKISVQTKHLPSFPTQQGHASQLTSTPKLSKGIPFHPHPHPNPHPKMAISGFGKVAKHTLPLVTPTLILTSMDWVMEELKYGFGTGKLEFAGRKVDVKKDIKVGYIIHVLDTLEQDLYHISTNDMDAQVVHDKGQAVMLVIILKAHAVENARSGSMTPTTPSSTASSPRTGRLICFYVKPEFVPIWTNVLQPTYQCCLHVTSKRADGAGESTEDLVRQITLRTLESTLKGLWKWQGRKRDKSSGDPKRQVTPAVPKGTETATEEVEEEGQEEIKKVSMERLKSGQTVQREFQHGQEENATETGPLDQIPDSHAVPHDSPKPATVTKPAITPTADPTDPSTDPEPEPNPEELLPLPNPNLPTQPGLPPCIHVPSQIRIQPATPSTRSPDLSDRPKQFNEGLPVSKTLARTCRNEEEEEDGGWKAQKTGAALRRKSSALIPDRPFTPQEAPSATSQTLQRSTNQPSENTIPKLKTVEVRHGGANLARQSRAMRKESKEIPKDDDEWIDDDRIETEKPSQPSDVSTPPPTHPPGNALRLVDHGVSDPPSPAQDPGASSAPLPTMFGELTQTTNESSALSESPADTTTSLELEMRNALLPRASRMSTTMNMKAGTNTLTSATRYIATTKDKKPTPKPAKESGVGASSNVAAAVPAVDGIKIPPRITATANRTKRDLQHQTMARTGSDTSLKGNATISLDRSNQPSSSRTRLQEGKTHAALPQPRNKSRMNPLVNAAMNAGRVPQTPGGLNVPKRETSLVVGKVMKNVKEGPHLPERISSSQPMSQSTIKRSSQLPSSLKISRQAKNGQNGSSSSSSQGKDERSASSNSEDSNPSASSHCHGTVGRTTKDSGSGRSSPREMLNGMNGYHANDSKVMVGSRMVGHERHGETPTVNTRELSSGARVSEYGNSHSVTTPRMPAGTIEPTSQKETVNSAPARMHALDSNTLARSRAGEESERGKAVATHHTDPVQYEPADLGRHPIERTEEQVLTDRLHGVNLNRNLSNVGPNGIPQRPERPATSPPPVPPMIVPRHSASMDDMALDAIKPLHANAGILDPNMSKSAKILGLETKISATLDRQVSTRTRRSSMGDPVVTFKLDQDAQDRYRTMPRPGAGNHYIPVDSDSENEMAHVYDKFVRREHQSVNGMGDANQGLSHFMKHRERFLRKIFRRPLERPRRPNRDSLTRRLPAPQGGEGLLSPPSSGGESGNGKKGGRKRNARGAKGRKGPSKKLAPGQIGHPMNARGDFDKFPSLGHDVLEQLRGGQPPKTMKSFTDEERCLDWEDVTPYKEKMVRIVDDRAFHVSGPYPTHIGHSTGTTDSRHSVILGSKPVAVTPIASSIAATAAAGGL